MCCTLFLCGGLLVNCFAVLMLVSCTASASFSVFGHADLVNGRFPGGSFYMEKNIDQSTDQCPGFALRDTLGCPLPRPPWSTRLNLRWCSMVKLLTRHTRGNERAETTLGTVMSLFCRCGPRTTSEKEDTEATYNKGATIKQTIFYFEDGDFH